ncbi:hypothetical protein [uncultured Lacinutrix sp.]|uniref:hypothetical protein n=1 Tax=uncultured Lacinutrix sp. TaxID=574032 RepID=UPI00263616EB|nr:hypothetical protein [uncultured Lacinutrix sp.]
MYNTAKILIILLLIVGCGKEEKNIKLISPLDNLKLTNNSIYISSNDIKIDSLNEIEAFIKIKQFKFIATNNGIYVLENNKITKQYSFHFKNHNLELLSVKFRPNSNNSKLLFITSTGQSSPALLSQIDLNTLNIDWINEYSKQIESANYSNNSNLIAIGTGYNKNKESSKHYSSLFLIESTNGKFLDYFRQGESVKKIKFSDNDQLLYSVLDWPHVYTYIWSINEKEKIIGSYGKDSTPYYDISTIDEQTFISIGKNGISKWNLSNEDKYELLYDKYINAGNKIFKFKNTEEYILIDYFKGTSKNPSIKYLNSDFKLTYSTELKNNVTNIVKSEFIFNGIDRDNNSIIAFDIEKRAVTLNLKIDSLIVKTTANNGYN